MRLTPDELRARKRRNRFLALGLVAFIVLVFVLGAGPAPGVDSPPP